MKVMENVLNGDDDRSNNECQYEDSVGSKTFWHTYDYTNYRPFDLLFGCVANTSARHDQITSYDQRW